MKLFSSVRVSLSQFRDSRNLEISAGKGKYCPDRQGAQGRLGYGRSAKAPPKVRTPNAQAQILRLRHRRSPCVCRLFDARAGSLTPKCTAPARFPPRALQTNHTAEAMEHARRPDRCACPARRLRTEKDPSPTLQLRARVSVQERALTP